MAYACPVCDALAPDGEHLAHHLAIVAMSRGGEHETWLDEHAAGWGDATPEELAGVATEHAEAVEHELADASADEHPDGRDHGHGAGSGRNAGQPGTVAGADRSNAAGDEETADALAEAREITQRMLDEEGDGAGSDEGAADEASDDEPAGTDSDE